jgi:glycerate 2-kinase
VKIVIAPDSFKENLTAMEVATAIETGIRRVLPNARCVKVPLADGGEGTVQALVDATGGRIVKKNVVGPLGNRVSARYGLLGDGATAVIEMAQASGLPLVPKNKRDPLSTTTYGTGELMIDALRRGAKSIIIGLGGSATVDGGAGMAQALGVKFVKKNGKPLIGYCAGGGLDTIAKIDVEGIDPHVRNATVIIASDVDNPLCGPRGAAQVFGPQKGATPEMVRALDRKLKHFGTLIRSQLGTDVLSLPGSGAAGGLGAGLIAFTEATMTRGIDLVIKATGLAKHLKDADLVITGEGRVDFQTAFGKTPSGVAAIAKKYRVPVVAIGGSLADDATGVYDHGIDGLESAAAKDMDLATALKSSREHLANAGERVIRLILIGRQMKKK